ncbi:MAG: hypothetical protein CMG00_07640 [Candidatus Marinimicrobia bacterium]|nr:hypothetical protein [Candidatus Neomarinimicrobiota bacterium]
MNTLPIEIHILIHSYLNLDFLPYNKYSLIVLRSNPIWKPRVIKKYNINKSTNFYELYKWQKKLDIKKISYERQYTLGCIGKITALQKPDWEPAIKIL